MYISSASSTTCCGSVSEGPRSVTPILFSFRARGSDCAPILPSCAGVKNQQKNAPDRGEKQDRFLLGPHSPGCGARLVPSQVLPGLCRPFLTRYVGQEGPSRAGARRGARRPGKRVTHYLGKGPKLGEARQAGGARRRPWWAWTAARPWTCPRCGAVTLTAVPGRGVARAGTERARRDRAI